MQKKTGLVALVVAAAVILLLVLYLFYPGVLPFTGPEKPQKPPVKSQAAPEPQEKPAPSPAPAPAPTPAPAPAPTPAPPSQATPPPAPAQPAAPLEKAAPPPEAPPPAPKESVQPPLEPKEEQGLLAGTFRNYAGARKLMEKLQKQGQDAFIKREGKKYQVWVGPFPTRKEAEAAAKLLKAKNKISPKIEKFVTPVPK